MNKALPALSSQPPSPSVDGTAADHHGHGAPKHARQVTIALGRSPAAPKHRLLKRQRVQRFRSRHRPKEAPGLQRGQLLGALSADEKKPVCRRSWRRGRLTCTERGRSSPTSASSARLESPQRSVPGRSLPVAAFADGFPPQLRFLPLGSASQPDLQSHQNYLTAATWILAQPCTSPRHWGHHGVARTLSGQNPSCEFLSGKGPATCCHLQAWLQLPPAGRSKPWWPEGLPLQHKIPRLSGCPGCPALPLGQIRMQGDKNQLILREVHECLWMWMLMLMKLLKLGPWPSLTVSSQSLLWHDVLDSVSLNKNARTWTLSGSKTAIFFEPTSLTRQKVFFPDINPCPPVWIIQGTASFACLTFPAWGPKTFMALAALSERPRADSKVSTWLVGCSHMG